MIFRILFVVASILVVILGTTRSAKADHPSRSPEFWKPTPNGMDAPSGSGFRSLFEKAGRACFKVPFTMQERALRERTGEAVGREPQTSLGAKSQGLSMFGASAAATGAVSWVIMHTGGNKPVVSIIPRLFSGGGGIGISIQW